MLDDFPSGSEQPLSGVGADERTHPRIDLGHPPPDGAAAHANGPGELPQRDLPVDGGFGHPDERCDIAQPYKPIQIYVHGVPR